MSTKSQKTTPKKNERMEAYDSLPPHIKEDLTEEERQMFLHSDHWSESLFKKLEEFIVSDQ